MSEAPSSSEADASLAEDLPWFLQGARVHFVHAIDAEGRPIPSCRGRAFQQDAKRSGIGAVAAFELVKEQPNLAERTQCLARMSNVLAEAIYAAKRHMD